MAYTHLTVDEREQIRSLLEQGFSKSQISERIGRHHSTVGRELRRNCNEGSKYVAHRAQKRAQTRRAKCIRPRRLDDFELRTAVNTQLALGWSPEQIAGYFGRDGTQSPVSARTIYRYLARLGRRKDPTLKAFFRYHPRPRRFGGRRFQRRGRIVGRVDMSLRPPHVELRQELGHWEGDTLVGAQRSSAIIVMVERKTRYTVAHKLANWQPRHLNEQALNLLCNFPPEKRRTVTVDNGREFSLFWQIAHLMEPGQIYYAPPYKPWKRGTCENTNGLLRDYMPKKTDLATVSHTQLNYYLEHLNNRPRKCLNWRTPAEAFFNEEA